MKKIILLLSLFSVLITAFSCEDLDDNPVPVSNEIKDFVWRGMNLYYLWQADVPDLANSKNDNLKEYYSFLNAYPDPIKFFNHLRIDKSIDKFSTIYSDYSVLEGVLSGNTLNNGMDYGLRRKSGSATVIYGWVRYILPNSDASTKNIQRGDIFYAINGISLYDDGEGNQNWYNLLNSNDTYTLNLANYNNGNITPNGKSVTLTKTNLTENPIFLNTVINQGSHNIGYLVYNGFYSSYDNQLNAVFGNFATQNVTDLVLDLRYNSGGSVNTATKLASMITGQFTNQVFARQQWNAKAANYYGSPENKFIGNLNSLNLNTVYILTSKSTASASELVINGLKPYINVVQIGDVTTGKNVGSITLYDSPNFTKSNVNPNHKYAMQPIVLKIVNRDGFGDYASGISPNHLLGENLNNMGILGDPNEPLLHKAIDLITGSGKKLPGYPSAIDRDFMDAKSINPLRSEMYLENK
ncbi:MAG: S41 family peptidase [Flavobacterium sp.]